MAFKVDIGVALLVGFVSIVIYAGTKLGHRGRNYPPGPPTLPFIGNVHQLHGCIHELCRKWSRQYNAPVLSLKLLHGDVLVLNTAKSVKDLIDKRSSVFSSRPPSYVVQGLIAQGDHPLFLPYGKPWSKLRKIMHSHFSADKCRNEHLYVQNAEACEVMYQMLHHPDDWYNHAKRFANSVITSLMYGVRAPTYDHWSSKGIFDTMDRWSEILELGAVPPVDILPILKLVPESIAGWKQEARVLNKLMNGLYGGLIAHCKERFRTGQRIPCLADQIIEQQKELELNDHQISFLFGVMLEGGSGALLQTAGSIVSFFLALLHKPEVLAKAHAEIDRVCGEDRSPTWDDWENLPYIRMIQKEVLRWRPVLPVGVPHYLEQDQVYEGMVLPKGATVLINAWATGMDPDKWGPDVEEFNPERYADYPLLASDYAVASDYQQRDHHAFGGGRRLCPGIHLAERNLFLEMAKLCWAFDWTSPIDPKTGKPHVPSVDFTDIEKTFTKGIIPRPHPFPIEIKVRSAKRAATIDRERAEAVKDVFSKFEVAETPSWWAGIQPKDGRH